MRSHYAEQHGCWRLPRFANLLFLVGLICLSGLAQAQTIQPPPGSLPCDRLLTQPLQKIPELVSANGVLRGTVVLKDQQVLLPFRYPPGNVPGTPNVLTTCFPQYVRVFEGVNAQPAIPPSPTGQLPLPLPGPTLRARVGDVIELGFLNQINPSNFGNSIDRAERGLGSGCDESTAGYPTAPKGSTSDVFPDCFHGSSTGNIHFHGTHTNPTATGDNVFVEVRPSPRDQKGNYLVTAQSTQAAFAKFFDACEERLKANPLLEWPTTWNDAPLGPPFRPNTWTAAQRTLLQAYDRNLPEPQRLWPIDELQYRLNAWPQYYIGAFPYCFRLPEYPTNVWPPPPQAMRMPVQMGPLMPPSGPLMMGQAPGTHWYHAHKHGSTTINVSNGMVGAFIIEGGYDDDLNAFYGTGWARTQPLMVINQLGVTPNLERRKLGQSDKGADFSVNGQIQPVLTMQPGQVQLWRIVNASSRSSAYFAALPQGFAWKQTAQDGVQFYDANYQASNSPAFVMAPGNRVDLLVKAPTTPGKYAVQVQSQVDPSDLASTRTPAYKLTLFTVNVADEPAASGNQSQFIPKAPGFPAFLADIGDNEVTGTKTMVFASGDGPPFSQHTIDGKKFDGELGAVVLLNKVEEWKIVNRTFGPAIAHPFHIHINPFQIVEVFDPNQRIDANGNPVFDPTAPDTVPKYVLAGLPGEQSPQLKPGQCVLDVNDPNSWHPCGPRKAAHLIWWDVFPIPSGLAVKDEGGQPVKASDGQQINIPGYFKLRSRFVDFPGQYVMHCHILAHEDRGMMTVVEVVPRQTAMSHQ
jgi:FtsP/CotA-like multicopper oxidase with cupredoxin domain